MCVGGGFAQVGGEGGGVLHRPCLQVVGGEGCGTGELYSAPVQSSLPIALHLAFLRLVYHYSDHRLVIHARFLCIQGFIPPPHTSCCSAFRLIVLSVTEHLACPPLCTCHSTLRWCTWAPTT